ncbi:MAG: VOC family protein [Microbacteriaceae bacterium]|nr:VOC family protein [Microbacteriaceae bacterium]MCL2794747.1 VOC family protein [Microbacteriaceae bacterium]
MSVYVSGVHILVDDPEAALVFYRDHLGLTVENTVNAGGFTWITLVTESQPELKIVLEQPHGGRSAENGDAVAGLLAKGELQMVQFQSADLEGTFEKVSAAPGAEVLQEPTDQPWGVRDFAVRDPAGNLIRIAQA